MEILLYVLLFVHVINHIIDVKLGADDPKNKT